MFGIHPTVRTWTDVYFVGVQERPVPLFQYEVVMYLAYVLYAPLYLAGPIVSFNAFASQVSVIDPTLVFWMMKTALL